MLIFLSAAHTSSNSSTQWMFVAKLYHTHSLVLHIDHENIKKWKIKSHWIIWTSVPTETSHAQRGFGICWAF